MTAPGGRDRSRGSAATVVDVHAHHMPLDLPDFAAKTGDPRWPRVVDDGGGRGRILRGTETFRPVVAACWDVDARIADLDRCGIDRQVISPVPVGLCDWADGPTASEFLATQNDAIAAAVDEAEGRLLGLGAVPVGNTEIAIAEMARCVEDLGLVGIELPTVVGGGEAELDDPALRPFFQAAADEDVPLFVHPTDTANAIRRHEQPYEFGIGMLTDTAMAASALVHGGVLDDVGELRIAFAHGCGSLPWTHPRTRLMDQFRGASSTHLDDLIATFYVDTLVFEPELIRLLVLRFGAEHLMAGSDHPFMPGGLQGARELLDDAVDLEILSPADAGAACGTNALTFLKQGDA